MHCFLELCHSEDPSVGEGQCCSKWLSKTQWVSFIAFTPQHLRGAEVWWLARWTLNWAIWVLFLANTLNSHSTSLHSVPLATLYDGYYWEKGDVWETMPWASISLNLVAYCCENLGKFMWFWPHTLTKTTISYMYLSSASTFVHWHMTEITLYSDRIAAQCLVKAHV